jgi:short-subunit dehydrogenase
VLVARRRDRLESLAAELGRARVIAADLALRGAAERLLAQVAQLGLHVDVLNIRARVELSHFAAPPMIASGRGAILNIASTAAFQPGPHFAVYFASKAFVLSFTEALHQELKGSGVKVSALCPGPTATEFGDVAGFTASVPAFLSADARSVVRAGLRGLDRNQAVIIPGSFNKLTAQSGRFLPRGVMRRIVARLKT